MHYTEIMSKSTDNKDKSKKISFTDPTGLSGLFQTINDTGHDADSTTCDFEAEREKFQIFIDSIPFGILLVDKNGFHTYLNPKFSEMFGYTLEDIPDRETWFEKAYPEASYRSYVQSRWLDNIDFIKPEEKKALMLNIACKDGSLKAIHIFPVQLKTGETLLLYEDFTERKRTEEKIEHLSSFPRLNPNPILETDMEGNITFYNQATINILREFGVREDPVLFLPENIQDILSNFQQGRIARHCSEIEINGSRLDVSIYYVERFGATHIYVNNITERKNTEEALQISEERYRNMFDSIPLPTMVYYLDTLSIIDVNKAAVKHYGYSRGEFLKMTVKDLLPHEDVANLLKCSSKTNPSQARGLWRHRKKDGTIMYVEVTAHALQFADKQYRIAIIDDVTETMKAAEELQFTQFAVDRAAVGIIWIRENGSILYINDETCRSLGYPRKELLNMSVHDINPEYKQETWGKAWRNVKRLGSITFETLYKRKDGVIFPVELTGNYMEYDGRGYICAIVRDITERKKTEESLKKREEELQIESNRLEEANTA